MANTRWVKKGTKSRGWRKTGRTRRKSDSLVMFKKPNSEQMMRLKILAYQRVQVAGAGPWGATFSLLFPGACRNTAGTIANMDLLPNFLFRVGAFFDVYRVRKLKVTYEPNLVDTSATVADIPDAVYMSRDYDDNNLVIESTILEDGKVPTPVADGRKVTCTMRPLKKNNLWLNASAMQSIANINAAFEGTTVITNNNNHGPIPLSSVKVLLPNQAAGNYGRFYCQWDVEFKGIAYN